MKRAIPAFALAFIACVLFILVTVTAPFIKTLYISKIVNAQDGSLGMNLGVFGYCFPGRMSVLGITLSDKACSKPAYPYQLDPKFLGFDNTPNSSNYNPLSSKFLQDDILSLLNGIGKALILNPISAAFAVLAFIPSLISICTTWRFTQILAWILLLLATLCSWISFIVNILFAAIVKNRVKKTTNGQYVGKYGNAIWISLIGAILMTLAMVFALFGACCCVKRKKVAPVPATHDTLETGGLVHGSDIHSTTTPTKYEADTLADNGELPKKKKVFPWSK